MRRIAVVVDSNKQFLDFVKNKDSRPEYRERIVFSEVSRYDLIRGVVEFKNEIFYMVKNGDALGGMIFQEYIVLSENPEIDLSRLKSVIRETV